MSNISFVKVIATVSQCLAKETILSKLINFVNIFRVNVADKAFDDSQKKYIDTIMKLDNSKTIMLETKGEEVKVQNMKDIELKTGQSIDIGFSELKEESTDMLFVNYAYLDEIPEGVQLAFDESDVVLQVQDSVDGSLRCVVEKSGSIPPQTLLDFVDYKPKLSFLSEKDKKDVIWGLQSGVNLLAASAVKKPEDVQSLREFLHQNNGEGIKIFVRLHTPEAYKNLDAIIESADGIICSHGSIGSFVPGSEETAFDILEIVKRKGKPFVVCVNSETYAANTHDFQKLLHDYILQGVDDVMITENIVEDEKLLDAILDIHGVIHSIDIEEQQLPRINDFLTRAVEEEVVNNYLIYNAYRATKDLPVRAIICYTNSGETVTKLVALRPTIPIIVFTKSDPVYRYINMLRGVKGYKISQTFNYASLKRIGKEMIRILFKGNISLDDKILILQAYEEGYRTDQQSDMINGIELYKFKNI